MKLKVLAAVALVATMLGGGCVVRPYGYGYRGGGYYGRPYYGYGYGYHYGPRW